MADKPVGPDCFGGEDAPHAPAAASLAAETQSKPVELHDVKIRVKDDAPYNWESTLLTYCEGGEVLCEEIHNPHDVRDRIAELIDQGITVKAWRPKPFERKTQITF